MLCFYWKVTTGLYFFQKIPPSIPVPLSRWVWKSNRSLHYFCVKLSDYPRHRRNVFLNQTNVCFGFYWFLNCVQWSFHINVNKLKEWGHHKSEIFLEGIIHAMNVLEDYRLEVEQEDLFTMKTGTVWEVLKSKVHFSEYILFIMQFGGKTEKPRMLFSSYLECSLLHTFFKTYIIYHWFPCHAQRHISLLFFWSWMLHHFQ